MPGRHRKPSRRRTTGRHRKPPQHSRWAVPAVAAVASVGFGGVATAAALTGGSDSATASPARQPGLASSRVGRPAQHPATTRVAGDHPSTTRVAAVHVTRPVLVVAAVGHVSWVEVVAGNHPLFKGLLQPGRSLSFSAHPLSVLLADAGAVRVIVRGQVRQLTGAPGKVLDLRVS